MRDVNRIDRICDKLKELWKAHPDQRFGQLVSNYIPATFYTEDEEKYAWRQGQSTETFIDKELERHNNWVRVRNETTYQKDHDEWHKKLLKSGRIGTSKLWEIEPNWEDYVKYLKPVRYHHVGRKCGKTNMILDEIEEEFENGK